MPSPSRSAPAPGHEPLLVANYRRLLRLYPRAHRERFGDEMAQLFRDQWRAVTARGGLTPRAAFVVRSAVDFASSCLREHAAALRTRFMQTSPRSSRLMPMIAGAMVAGLVMAFTATVLTQMPRVYLSTTRILMEKPTPAAGTPAAIAPYDPYWFQTQFEILRSSTVLDPVVGRLGLAQHYASDSLLDATPKPREAASILRDRLEFRQYPNTHLLEIGAYDENPQIAAAIANAVAATYLEVRAADRTLGESKTQLIDVAEPGLRPVRPNVYLGGFLGGLTGLGLGVIAGFVVWWLRRHRVTPAPPAAS